MRSLHDNLMSIEQFAELALLDPLAVGGWCVMPADSGCRCDRDTYFEYTYQGKWLSRQEISLAIQDAEQKIADELGFWSAPKRFIGEVQKYPQPDRGRRSYTNRPDLARSTMITTDGKDFKSITANWGFIQGVGRYVETDLGTTTTLNRDAATGMFTATLTLPAAPTGNESYRAFFVESDRLGQERDLWEVRQLTFSVSGTTLTIKGGSYALMKPEKRLGRKWECKAPETDSNYVTELTVISEVLDDTQQGSLQWGAEPCTEADGCNDVISHGVCMYRDDSDGHGVLRPKPMEYDADTESWISYDVKVAPDYVVFNYVAGYPRTASGRVAEPLAKATFYLAASLLETDAALCGCDGDGARKRLKKYRDVEKTVVTMVSNDPPNLSGKEERILARAEQITQDWGGRYGAVRAWAEVQKVKNRNQY